MYARIKHIDSGDRPIKEWENTQTGGLETIYVWPETKKKLFKEK